MQRVLAFTAYNSSTSSSALTYTVDIKDTEAVTPRKAQEGKNDVVACHYVNDVERWGK